MRGIGELRQVYAEAFNLRANTSGWMTHEYELVESGVRAVRNAVLDDLIEGCQGGSAGPYKLMDGWYCEGCVTETFVEEWLRSHKESQ